MGAATAVLLKERGAEVHGIDLKTPDQSLDTFTKADLRSPASIDAAVSTIKPPVHHLFNCAGLPRTFDAMDVFRVNFLGLRYITELVFALMPNGGSIASVSSTAGHSWVSQLEPISELLAIGDFDGALAWSEQHRELIGNGYSFSKACVVAYTLSRNIDFLLHGVRMNCVTAGPTDTPMYAELKDAIENDRMTPRPLGRLATAEEQAEALLFLNSGTASYIAGAELWSDGGYLGARATGRIAGGK
jgi:NAD(P)-dependent dehydrogenase (short-subunit alcohol dehydrogenase family)